MNLQHWRERYQSLSPPMRWIVALGVPAILVWMYYDYALLTAAEWREAANEIEAKLRDAETADREARINRLRSAVLAFGEVELPLPVEQGREAMNNAITEVTQRHRVTVESITNRGLGNMPADALDGVLENGSAARLLVDLQFEARPEQAIDLISDLESNPHIHAISSVRMSKGRRSGRVLVDLTVASWVQVPDGTRRRGGLT